MRDRQIDQSWQDNANAWVDAVREGRIPSRRAGTDAAIVQAITELSPSRVLDAGCGEGWLARQLSERGIDVTGFDGSAPLIERATEAGGARFIHLTYSDFIAEPIRAGRDYDVVAFNFSLFAEDIVPSLRAAACVVSAGGHVIIQTVHPFNDALESPYRDGWREETFTTMSPDFVTPMPWYFRTMETWINSVVAAGLQVRAVREPFNVETGKPLSLLLIASA